MIDSLAVAERELARRLTLRYLVASTLVLFVSGALGVVLRSSQAGLGRLSDNGWYAVMTAHGLGAFLGWAGFAVMGLAWWVLAEVGFPLRRVGRALAEATWWLMVLGVAGVVVSTLILRFAGSWVFLYPLPFHSAGGWGKWASAIFLFSVLLVGLSIVTWCVAVLHTVVGPALHAVRPSITNRLGVAFGFGYLWPERFATNPKSVPYPVIPLAVIGVDMIIATLPLAVLLVEMIVQSFTPSVHVDPLLAKNVLWWFGHPVVYLLLFPAVAVYYLLIPRYAGRPLVAGNVIAIAWAVAVVANVVVWAHHVYLDYPVGVQSGINTAMQPTTFALVLPSALSLYSLGFTIYRSNFIWNAASLALFLGLVNWLLAGLSGIVNATIAADRKVHNTLWIVGHFHEMALMNIGFVIFAAIYAWGPELLGRKLWSDALGKWHIWLTFILAGANSVLWLIQGLDGAPRRFAVLPDRYVSLSQAGAGVSIALGLAQLLFVWNMVQTIRGAEPRVAHAGPHRRRIDTVAVAMFPFVAVLFAGLMFGVGIIVGRATKHGGGGSAAPSATSSASTTSAATTTTTAANAQGKQVFTANCAGCHTLKDAGTSGNVGPNLDKVKPPMPLVVDRVTHGKGAMPAFKGTLSDAQIKAVAQYVSQVAGH